MLFFRLWDYKQNNFTQMYFKIFFPLVSLLCIGWILSVCVCILCHLAYYCLHDSIKSSLGSISVSGHFLFLHFFCEPLYLLRQRQYITIAELRWAGFNRPTIIQTQQKWPNLVTCSKCHLLLYWPMWNKLELTYGKDSWWLLQSKCTYKARAVCLQKLRIPCADYWWRHVRQWPDHYQAHKASAGRPSWYWSCPSGSTGQLGNQILASHWRWISLNRLKEMGGK